MKALPDPPRPTQRDPIALAEDTTRMHIREAATGEIVAPPARAGSEVRKLAWSPGGDDDKLLQVHEALDELAATEPLQADVVKLRFFVGMSNEEAALALGINEKTVRRRWNHAKLWLYEKIQFGP